MNYNTANSNPIGTKIKDLRKWLRISQLKVGEFLSVPRTAVSAIESGKREVTANELFQLSKLFRCDPNSLLGLKITPVDTAKLDLNFKARLNKDTILNDHDMNEIANFTEFLKLQKPKTESKFSINELKSLRASAPQKAAEIFLKKFTNSSPTDIYSILIDLGIYPRFTALIDLAGAIVRAKNQMGEEIFGILINSDQPEERMRFSAAHETGHFVLGHLEMEKEDVHVSRIARWKDAVELDADNFAAECLMPKTVLDTEVKKYSKTGITALAAIQLADTFMTSFRAIVNRLLELNHISQIQYEEFLKLKVTDLREQNKGSKKIKSKPFDEKIISPLFAYLKEHTTNKAFIESPDCVRWLQESSYFEYYKVTTFEERATDVKEVYEIVALWLAKQT